MQGAPVAAVIGHGGGHLQELMRKHDVQIHASTTSCEIRGDDQTQVDRAAAAVATLIADKKKKAPPVCIPMPVELASGVIGTSGCNISNIEQKHNVRIHIDKESGACEISHRSTTGTDAQIRAAVNDCAELIECKRMEKERVCSKDVILPLHQWGNHGQLAALNEEFYSFVFGPKGAHIKQLEKLHGAWFHVDKPLGKCEVKCCNPVGLEGAVASFTHLAAQAAAAAPTLALYKVCKKGGCDDHEAVSQLVGAGANVDWTGCQMAAATRAPGQCQRKQPNEGNCAQCDEYGNTPLHWCAWTGKKGSITALIEAGADVTIHNRFGETALQVAQAREAASPHGDTAIANELMRAAVGTNRVPGAQGGRRSVSRLGTWTAGSKLSRAASC